MGAWEKVKTFYKATEISPELPSGVNCLNMILQFIYSMTVAIIAAIFPIRYGFIYICHLLEKNKIESPTALTLKEGIVTFQGGCGAFFILVGFLAILVTVYRVRKK